jgi:hypothetical protein
VEFRPASECTLLYDVVDSLTHVNGICFTKLCLKIRGWQNWGGLNVKIPQPELGEGGARVGLNIARTVFTSTSTSKKRSCRPSSRLEDKTKSLKESCNSKITIVVYTYVI